MSLMVDKMIEYSKDKHSLNCLVPTTGEFIIPLNLFFGKSRHQRVLGRLQDEKNKKKKRKRDGKWKRKVVDDGEVGEDRKCPPEDAGDRESTKSPPEVTGDGDDQDGDGWDNTC